jgi:hypothetical protein
VPILTYDSARNVVVLFGGTGEDGDVFDTWEWDGEAWTQIEDEGPQAPWFTSNVVYDAARQVTVLESGLASSFAGRGTWTWDGSAWMQLTNKCGWDGVVWKEVQNIGPSARQGSGIVGTGDDVLLFGGPTRLGWSETPGRGTASTGASGRTSARFRGNPPGMAWDAGRDRVVLFGGVSPNPTASLLVGDTWEAFETP